MDDQERERLAAWLRDKWNHGPCPVCQSNVWQTSARLGQISNLNFEGGRVPVLHITCQTCGYIVTINALVAGIRPTHAARDAAGEPVFFFTEDEPSDEVTEGAE